MKLADGGANIKMRHYNIQGNTMTKGEYRVGIDFNPSSNSSVSDIKRAAADLIDLIANLDDKGDPEYARCKALGMTAVEDGAMWGVKAATKKPMG